MKRNQSQKEVYVGGTKAESTGPSKSFTWNIRVTGFSVCHSGFLSSFGPFPLPIYASFIPFRDGNAYSVPLHIGGM